MPQWTITSMPGVNPKNDSTYARHRDAQALQGLLYHLAVKDFGTFAFIKPGDSTINLEPLLGLELTYEGPVIFEKEFLKNSGCKKQGDNNFIPLLNTVLEDVCKVMAKKSRTDFYAAPSFNDPNTTVNFMSIRPSGYLSIRTGSNKIQILFYRGKMKGERLASNGYQWEIEYQ